MEKIGKHLLNRVSWNGLDYFRTMLPELIQVNDTQCNTVKSPIRDDRNASFSVFQNRKTSIWLYHDFGTGQKGDMYDLAGQLYGLDIKGQFPLILQKMAEDMGVEEMTDEDLDKILNPTWNAPFTITLPGLVKRRKNKILSLRSRNKKQNTEEKHFVLDILPFSKLEDRHIRWMGEYGILTEAMAFNKACFITGYTTYHDEKPVYKSLPDNEVWLAYQVDKCAKLYCTTPKKFYYLGNKPKNYLFGTTQPFEDEQIVLLVGGEKDVLTAKSHGFEAFCLNSETQQLSRNFLKEAYFDKRYKIVVVYDLDETGIMQSKKLNELHGLSFVTLPNWVKEKGGKDISDFFKLGGNLEELQDCINDAINGVNTAVISTVTFAAAEKEESSVEVMGNTKTSTGMRTAQQRLLDASKMPIIRPYVDVFFQEGELVILFGDTGKGKSIAAVAIGDAISKGTSFLGLDNGVGATRVLYYDFELSDRQFGSRYTNEAGIPYSFSSNFFIDNIDLSELFESKEKRRFEDVLLDRFRSDIIEKEAQVIIIDNITFLCTQTPEDSQVALTLMKLLKDLKDSMNISILVLAHTPKKIGSLGIALQDLAGSKHLSNFADGVIALGDVKSERNLRYLIQAKPSRSGEPKYDKGNVLVCELEKEDSFLSFRFVKFCPEYELFRPADGDERDVKLAQIKQLKAEGKTIREIAGIVGIPKSTVGNWLAGEK